MIIEAAISDKSALMEFDDLVVNRLDKSNPFVVSIRNDAAFLNEAFTESARYRFFLVKEGSRSPIIARCAINTYLDSDDICAYGERASQMFCSQRMASLIGDLVHPDKRGLGIQRRMIDFRLELLANIGYDVAVAGILDGNQASWTNYIERGFEPVGTKQITWEAEPGRTDNVTLLYRPLR